MIDIYRYPTLCAGVFVRRYKRFLVDIELADKEVVTAFCPNSGSMKGCCSAGFPVMLSRAQSTKRKTHYTLEMIKVDGVWVGVNTMLTNDIAHRVFELRLLEELASCDRVKREVRFHDSRLDFLLFQGNKQCYIEVKNVTLQVDRVAMFPDAVTVRGRKHLFSLKESVEMGYDAYMLYMVTRSDCIGFAPAKEIDPEYAAAYCFARKNGVKVIALTFDVRPDRISFLKRICL